MELLNKDFEEATARIAVVFVLDKNDMFQALIVPQFPEEMTEEEKFRAGELVLFVHGLVEEGKNGITYFKQKGIEVLKASAEEEKKEQAQLNLDLKDMEVKGNA